jgi:hypothetical protein
MAYALDNHASGFDSWQMQETFLFSQHTDWLWGKLSLLSECREPFLRV